MISRRGFLGLSALVATVATPSGLAEAKPSTEPGRRRPAPPSNESVLPVDIVNSTGVGTVYALIYGYDPGRGNALAFLMADGRTLYYPPSPANPLAPIEADLSIPVAGPAAARVLVPKLVSGRMLLSLGREMRLFLNPGPSVVQPSVNNPSDPNIATQWGFFEFTYDDAQLYANVSFVDFVSLPIGLRLQTDERLQTVSGLGKGGLAGVAAALRQQTSKDGANWDRLVITRERGRILRVLSPNQASTPGDDFFAGYLDAYVDSAWERYRRRDLTIETQGAWGQVTGRVGPDDLLRFPGAGAFARPSTYAVFNCSVPPFTTGNDEMGNLSARLAAALNRTTLHLNPSQPLGERIETFYDRPRTNHYARIVHAATADGLGYAFPYDDVHNSSFDVQGRVVSTTPRLLTVTVSGPG